MVRIIEGRLVSGWDKASALLLAISDECRKILFSSLEDREIRDLSVSMSSLGVVDSQVVDSVLVEFLEIMQRGKNVIGGFDETRKMLESMFGPERAKLVLEGLDEGKAGVWDQLSHVQEDILLKFLQKEKPQTIAVILSRVSPTQSANILKMLPEEVALEVVVRILKTSSVKKEVLLELQRSLKIEFMEEVERSARGADPHKILAEIFNALDRQTEEHFMGVLESTLPESAERVKSLMFTFDDLVRLDRPGIQRVIREVDKGLLAMSLKGVSDQIKDLFFSNMSERAAKLLREDIAALGSVRLRDVEEAQTQVMVTVKQLVQTGEIALAETSESDELIG